MAYKDSDQIENDSNYALGDYSFRIERTSVPGSSNDKIEAICTDKDGKNARKSIQVPSSTQLDGWYVEANETEATVYAVVKVPKGGSEYSSDLDVRPAYQPIPAGGSLSIRLYNGEGAVGNAVITLSCERICGFLVGNSVYYIAASSSNGYCNYTYTPTDGGEPFHTLLSLVAVNTIDGKTAYGVAGYLYSLETTVSGATEHIQGDPRGNIGNIAWTMVYGTPSGNEYELVETLVARFAIDLEDAGGDGPGSDWIDPGDYDPDWEEGDPTHTLYVDVTGALSGRHNDPIEDPSYSYIPADKDTVKDYGCGGDGGHGGGGGAGASTVVVHKFATNQANRKEVTAIARRHGYGSGGGKGGKGGDGCILVYY